MSQDPVGQVVDRQGPDVVTVEPVQLVQVEDRADHVDPRPVELGRHLREREDLALVRHRVAHQAEEVDQRLGQVALLAEPGQPGRRVLALADLGAVVVAQQRHVRELRRLQTEPLVEQDVLRRRADPLLTAHDVGDAHLVVVDDDGQVVRREAVGLEDDLVVGVRRVDLAADQVLEVGLDVVRDPHPHHRIRAEPGQLLALLARLAQAEPVVAGRLLGLLLGLAHLGQPLGGAPAVVGVAVGEQALDVRPVGLEPLGLAVRRERAADVRALVPLQAEPAQGVEDLLLAVLAEARPVGVLDAQHELAALLADEGEVEERDVRRADVRVTGRRRRDAQADRTDAATPWSATAHERVGEHADALDLDLDPLPGGDRADAGRRPGQDQVTGQQRHHRRDVGDQLAGQEVSRCWRAAHLAVDGRQPRSVTSSSVWIHGPIGQNVSNPLARAHWPSRRCRSRAVTSLAQV